MPPSPPSGSDPLTTSGAAQSEQATKRKRGRRGGRRRGKRSQAEQRIQAAARVRQEAWQETAKPYVTGNQTAILEQEFGNLRVERSGEIPVGRRVAGPAPEDSPGKGGGMAR